MMIIVSMRAIGRVARRGAMGGFDAPGAPARLRALALAAVLAALAGAGLAGAPEARAETASADAAASVEADLQTLRGYRFGQLRGLRIHDAPGPAFDASFLGPDRAPMTLADRSGKVLFVNFWATWCAPCLHEMPSIDRLVGALEAEGLADRVEVLTISVDRGDPGRPLGWLEREGLERLAFYHDPENATPIAAKLRGMPTTLIVDAAGRELARLEGPAEWDGAEVVALLRDLAGGDG